MPSDTTAPRTTLAVPVAAEGPISFQHLERMAASVAKSGLFAVKTPEAALTLMLVAQAENVHPVQAIMDYDVIEGKPVLKSSAMLARFLRAGGQVEWIECKNEVVTGKFTSPKGVSLVVTWDQARVEKAGLATKANHAKFPMQMKRARCISEGIRALWPVTQLYTPEEMQDNPAPIDVTPERIETAVQHVADASTALTEDERDLHFNALDAAKTTQALQEAFSAAWIHAKEAKDSGAQGAFRQVYDARKADLAANGAPL